MSIADVDDPFVTHRSLLFTVANRSATLLDFSADILSGVDVYKTATADQMSSTTPKGHAPDRNP